MRAREKRRDRTSSSRPRAIAACAAAVVLLSGCELLGSPPMAPLTETMLQVAEQRWEAHGSGFYRVAVRVRAPRLEPTVYDVVVMDGVPVEVSRNGESVGADDIAHYDYSVSGLFDLLRDDLDLADVVPVGDTPPVDLRAYFESDTGRLIRYRRTVGTARRRVLLVEVLRYEPLVG